MLKQKFVARLARSLDLPEALVDAMTAECACGSRECEGWRVARLPWPEEIQQYGLEQRVAQAGWRTLLASLIEE